MNALKKEIYEYVDILSEHKLKAILPVLAALAEDEFIIDNSLTAEELDVIKEGRKEYERGGFISLDDI